MNESNKFHKICSISVFAEMDVDLVAIATCGFSRETPTTYFFFAQRKCKPDMGLLGGYLENSALERKLSEKAIAL